MIGSVRYSVLPTRYEGLDLDLDLVIRGGLIN